MCIRRVRRLFCFLLPWFFSPFVVMSSFPLRTLVVDILFILFLSFTLNSQVDRLLFKTVSRPLVSAYPGRTSLLTRKETWISNSKFKIMKWDTEIIKWLTTDATATKKRVTLQYTYIQYLNSICNKKRKLKALDECWWPFINAQCLREKDVHTCILYNVSHCAVVYANWF